MPVVLYPILALAVLVVFAVLVIRRRQLTGRLASAVLAEVLGHRLGEDRRLQVADLAWHRASARLWRLDPAFAREVDAYYRLAADAKAAIEEPVPLRLASRPGEVARFWRERQRLALALRRRLGVKEAGLTHTKRLQGGRPDAGFPVGRRHIGLPGRGGHRTRRLDGLRGPDRQGVRRGG